MFNSKEKEMKKLLFGAALLLSLAACKKNKTYVYELSVTPTNGDKLTVMLGEEYLHIGEVKPIIFKAGYNPPEVRGSLFDTADGSPFPDMGAKWKLKRGEEVVAEQTYYIFLWQ